MNNNLFIIPALISSAVVLVVYMMKKNEEDESKKPNYSVLFLTCLALSGGVVYFLQSPEDTINLVMKEIDVGEVPF